jgi:stearoyl-CoA desaturase (delta-9 desaturase)
MYGVLDLSFWGCVAAILCLTHITIIAVTVYLHRHQAHRALTLHAIPSHFFRFWLWLTTGMVTRQWIAVHRKHHARVETRDDPHSPQVLGLRKVLLEGTELYGHASSDQATIERYGHGAPDDWLERNLYTRFSNAGLVVMFLVDLVLFGVAGVTIWAVQMMWIPFFAAGVVNGVGHFWGYRNFETTDASSNIVPWGIVIGGEELHNNHHAFASSARLSCKWWEIDFGWWYIRLLTSLRLARVKKTIPKAVVVPQKRRVDRDTVTAILNNRFQVMAQYARTVLSQVHKEEVRKADASLRNLLKRAGAALVREESRLTKEAKETLEVALNHSDPLKVAYQHKRRLQAIWQERSASQERLLVAVQEWCKQAESSGIRALQDFARSLPGYSLRTT